MKITCILASYNRPTWLRQALKSVADQTHKDYELVVVDESTLFDIGAVVAEFRFAKLTLIKERVSPQERAKTNRLSVNINKALQVAEGDLICYLADDDFLFPGWFEAGSDFFHRRPDVHAGFGKLFYTRSRDLDFSMTGKVRYYKTPIRNPYCVLDHNQVMHRRLVPPIFWDENKQSLTAPDGLFFREVGKRFVFYPMETNAAVKRLHDKNLVEWAGDYWNGSLGELRE